MNTSPIIAFSIIGKLDLLKSLFQEVYISQAVYNEIMDSENHTIGKDELTKEVAEGHIKIYKIKDPTLVNQLYGKLHKGELETIIGGRELDVDYVLIDELAARNMAKTFFLTPIGTIGILRIAKHKGIINEIKPFLDQLINKGYWISKSLYHHILTLENEN